jgi:hypothetical protein
MDDRSSDKKKGRKEFENEQNRVTQHGTDEMPHEFITCDFLAFKQAPRH